MPPRLFRSVGQCPRAPFARGCAPRDPPPKPVAATRSAQHSAQPSGHRPVATIGRSKVKAQVRPQPNGKPTRRSASGRSRVRMLDLCANLTEVGAWDLLGTAELQRSRARSLSHSHRPSDSRSRTPRFPPTSGHARARATPERSAHRGRMGGRRRSARSSRAIDSAVVKSSRNVATYRAPICDCLLSELVASSMNRSRAAESPRANTGSKRMLNGARENRLSIASTAL